MSQPGWEAGHIIEALLAETGLMVKEVSERTGILPNTISSYRTNKLPLGRPNAIKLGAVFEAAGVSDATARLLEPAPSPFRDVRMEELEERVDALSLGVAAMTPGLAEELAGMGRRLADIEERLGRLEAGRRRQGRGQ